MSGFRLVKGDTAKTWCRGHQVLYEGKGCPVCKSEKPMYDWIERDIRRTLREIEEGRRKMA